MKVSSKFFRCSLVLMLALTVAFSAAVGVSADTSTPWIGLYYGNNTTLNSYTINSGTIVPDLYYRLGFIIYHKGLLPDYTYTFTVTIDMYQASAGYSHYTDDIYELSLVTGNPGKFEEGGNLINIADIQYMKDNERIIYNITFNTSDVEDLINNTHLILACNPVYDNLIAIEFVSAYCNAIYDPEKTEMMQIIEKLENIESNQNNINNTLNNIEYDLSYIINYGSDYNQIDQTIINNLGSAEDQLSSAEDAIENKSKSLMQQASAGLSKATTASQTLVTSLTTTIPQVYSFATDIIEVTPPEVQAAVLAIPLLSFAVWLIGLRR